MTVKRTKSTTGFTLIETMAAILILLIAVLGTSAFRYNAALSARKADLHANAARTALLLCESWRGASDPCTFDPAQLTSAYPTSVLSIQADDYSYYHVIQEVQEGFAVLGAYKTVTNGGSYDAVLSWKDVSDGLRALNVVVGWNQRGSGPDYPDYYSYPDKFFKLTTYITD